MIDSFIWSTTPGECFVCHQPTNTIHVDFETPMHVHCEQEAWRGYWKAMRR